MSEAAKRQMTLGMIVGNRGFFPDHLARSGHQEMRTSLESAGVKVVALSEAESKFGAVETREEARRCADLFKQHREAIDGIVVTLPNFGDERAIADTLRMAGLSCAPVDAAPEVLREVAWISKLPAGRGAVRDLCALILGAKVGWPPPDEPSTTT